ncbi:MAG: lipoprotein cytochrome [Geobacteraceae bacterium]|nr:MAG: lipoprotein cytochrome [Geobacteraceae bacterium]
MDTFACRRCHTIGGKGNRPAANLDSSALLRQPREIFHAIQSPVQYMPDFRPADGEITDMVNAILAGATAKKSKETPLVVHFQNTGTRENIFEKHCGACHRMLSTRDGGIGKGEIGPNLSGLFSPFYPATFRERERWSAANLKKWVANPRRIKNGTLMQPIPLNEQEFAGLTEILQH